MVGSIRSIVCRKHSANYADAVNCLLALHTSIRAEAGTQEFLDTHDQLFCDALVDIKMGHLVAIEWYEQLQQEDAKGLTGLWPKVRDKAFKRLPDGGPGKMHGLDAEVLKPIKAVLKTRLTKLKKISLTMSVAKRVEDARPFVEGLDVAASVGKYLDAALAVLGPSEWAAYAPTTEEMDAAGVQCGSRKGDEMVEEEGDGSHPDDDAVNDDDDNADDNDDANNDGGNDSNDENRLQHSMASKRAIVKNSSNGRLASPSKGAAARRARTARRKAAQAAVGAKERAPSALASGTSHSSTSGSRHGGRLHDVGEDVNSDEDASQLLLADSDGDDGGLGNNGSNSKSASSSSSSSSSNRNIVVAVADADDGVFDGAESQALLDPAEGDDGDEYVAESQDVSATQTPASATEETAPPPSGASATATPSGGSAASSTMSPNALEHNRHSEEQQQQQQQQHANEEEEDDEEEEEDADGGLPDEAKRSAYTVHSIVDHGEVPEVACNPDYNFCGRPFYEFLFYRVLYTGFETETPTPILYRDFATAADKAIVAAYVDQHNLLETDATGEEPSGEPSVDDTDDTGAMEL